MALVYVPRESAITGPGGKVSPRWDDAFFIPLAQSVNALNASILSGPDADPNGIVIGSPGYLYRRVGAATSQLFIKESGVNTDTGWVGK